MNLDERKALISRIDSDVKRIQQRLDECHSQALNIADDFKTERGEILREIRRQTKRGQHSKLILKVMRRQRRVMAVPIAEWRTIAARGNRVARAQQTLGQVSGGQEAVRGRMAIFSSTLPMNRKDGWRISDLRTHAHPAEVELVAATETRLHPIRRRVAELVKTGQRLLQRRHQHQLMVDRGPAAAKKKANRTRKAPNWALTENQLSLELEPTTTGELFERPQLRNPDQ